VCSVAYITQLRFYLPNFFPSSSLLRFHTHNFRSCCLFFSAHRFLAPKKENATCQLLTQIRFVVAWVFPSPKTEDLTRLSWAIYGCMALRLPSCSGLWHAPVRISEPIREEAHWRIGTSTSQARKINSIWHFRCRLAARKL